MKSPSRYNTERIHLRIPQIADAKTIFEAYAQDIDVCRYMTWRPFSEFEPYESWLADKIDSIGKTSLAYMLCDTDDHYKVYGMIDARIESFTAEVGYALSQDQWGKGLMTEALTSFVKLLLTEDEIYRVCAVCDLDNPASARVMEKSGMSYEGILKRYIIHPNISDEPRDVKSYSITKQ